MAAARLAVLGSPIAHSLSPTLHHAAYGVLGLDWQYDAVDVTGDGLTEFLRTRDGSWRGLSLTMPLKKDVIPLLDRVSDLVTQTGSANTVRFEDGTLAGFNTDVFGITESFVRHGRHTLRTVLILGGGATAASALVAAARLGATRAFVGVRALTRATDLVNIGRSQGVEVIVRELDHLIQIDERLDAVISTLPNGVEVSVEIDADVVTTAVLLDVAYHPWPSALAARWPGDGVISGREMLVLQALAQVRIFVSGDPARVLQREDEVLAAMLASVAL